MPNVNDKMPELAESEAQWQKIDALMGGTETMRAAGQRYLPRWPAEDEQTYAFRLKTSTLFNAFRRSLLALAGKPFSRPLTFGENIPAILRDDWLTNVDLAGRNLHVFCRDWFERGLRYGISYCLVDYPPVSGVRTVADERAIGARPYATLIHPGSVLGFLSERIRSVETLTQFRYMERAHEPDGRFATKVIKQVRVLEPGRWEIWRENNKREWALYDEGNSSLDYIPIVPFYGERTGFMLGRSPLLDLAELNIEHWQSASDQRNILHVARVPLLFGTGFDESDGITAGAQSFIRASNPDADLRYVEHAGRAIESGRQDLQDIEERMRAAGAELLVKRSGARTATESAIDSAESRSQLQALAEDFEDAIDLMLQYMADWARLGDGGNVTVYKDFSVDVLGGSEAVLQGMAASGVISNQTMFEEMQRRNILSPDRVWDDESERLNEQGPALGMINADS